MKRLLLLCIFFSFFLFPGFSETIYVYTFEECNEKPVPLEAQVKEGILEGLFEAGHIVFDDISDAARGNLLLEDKISTLLSNVKKGGAYYLVGARILSTITKLENNKEVIESSAYYYVYDAEKGTLLHEGNTKIDNRKDYPRLKKESLWFTLGKIISEEVSLFYNGMQN